MGSDTILNPAYWPAVESPFWSVVIFVFGSIVGSFLNVVIHRLPRGESVVSPPSHCPHCNYSIPWWLNIPLLTWLYLGGKCKNCGAPISVRYFLVELLTALAFLTTWLTFSGQSVLLALVYCLVLAGLLASSFIDLEHLIIPDELTIGGTVAGIFFSLIPVLHGQTSVRDSLWQGFLGAAVGGGVIYTILRLGKLMFGRQKILLPPGTKIIFSETNLCLPDREIPYEELFYRKSDTITLEGRFVETIDRGYGSAQIRLSQDKLLINDDPFVPEDITHLEAITDTLYLPREAMGLGDVKFMAAIGAFLGWQAVLFSLMVSSIIGSLVGGALVLLGRKDWSSRLPYGPYIALAAVIWIFAGRMIVDWVLH
jgi:leader peptidase (prepilin peptidase)/N-methyltransferase